jgi:salicylate hydroxylase
VQSVSEKGPGWQRWPLFKRAPLAGPQGMWQPDAPGVAHLGDAAHPMLPYLAQGAGMAMEDADALAHCLQGGLHNPAQDLAAYARLRWQRNAQVQARAARNASIFHADGAVRLARNLVMRGLGSRLLDQPWLYGVQE